MSKGFRHLSALKIYLIHDIISFASLFQFAVHRGKLLLEFLNIVIELIDLVLSLLILDSQCCELVSKRVAILYSLLDQHARKDWQQMVRTSSIASRSSRSSKASARLSLRS
jgi:hypothetical protein